MQKRSQARLRNDEKDYYILDIHHRFPPVVLTRDEELGPKYNTGRLRSSPDIVRNLRKFGVVSTVTEKKNYRDSQQSRKYRK